MNVSAFFVFLLDNVDRINSLIDLVNAGDTRDRTDDVLDTVVADVGALADGVAWQS